MANSALPSMKELNPLLAPYQMPAWKPAIGQLLTTVPLYFALLALMFFAMRVSYALTLLLSIPAAGLLIRTFILFHDAGHNSFTPSLKANKAIAFILGVITFTPGAQWARSHAIHHATAGNLDKRGIGDVTTLTVEEYKSKHWAEKVAYQLFRFPFIMFGLGPLWMFLIHHRMAAPRFSQRETNSVIWTNLALVVYVGGLSFLMGSFWTFAAIQLPVLWLGGMFGIWLFYIQHQFEGVYWARDPQWDYVSSALKGASFFSLPPVLQWFTGNIGYHHIHHLSPRIPNYRLEECHRNNPIFQQEVKEMGFFEAFRMLKCQLIDEARGGQMVTFQDILG